MPAVISSAVCWRGGIHEYVIGCMEKNMPKGWLAKHPDIVQNVVTAVGTLVGSITGNKKSSGYISQMGTKWNEYYLEQRERTNEELLAEKNKERQEYSFWIKKIFQLRQCLFSERFQRKPSGLLSL